MSQIKTIIEQFAQHQVVKCKVCFSGCGDSGSIDDIDYWYEDGNAENVSAIYSALDAEVTDFVYDLLDNVGVDWYNNDGGGGHVTFYRGEGGKWLHNVYVYQEERIETVCVDITDKALSDTSDDTDEAGEN
ncbi:MAG: hypothetical protein ACO32I_06335 [Candidatus Limnocylindrus sp.]